ncbi:MAG: hypothetical protein V7727_18010 [Sneathiella sp.]
MNIKPTNRGEDDGIWRRVYLVQFDVEIPGLVKDPYLKEKLFIEKSGFLNWVLDGYRD